MPCKYKRHIFIDMLLGCAICRSDPESLRRGKLLFGTHTHQPEKGVVQYAVLKK